MFKVGSKVVCVEQVGCTVTKGKEYVVEDPGLYLGGDGPDTSTYVYVRTNQGRIGGMYHRRFRPVEAASTSSANDPATSKGKRKVNKYEQAVLDMLYNYSSGCTGKEIASYSGHPLNCITPRFAPLRRKGLIKDNGIKRDKQIVWVLA